ncbi:hypothetical protein E5S67_06390 [Microcoleus sp. IPMA8]|uniref:Transposase n=1 Tax=Microcoleus asticus IPMA8 TaxID=2563858 RepID=A0ABX2D7G0_9CYAN|nr:hypothetical protein [Microcoleus asticus IPMA8]
MRSGLTANVTVSKQCLKTVKPEDITSEGSQASPDKLIVLMILIALAMTSAWLQGKRTKLQGQEKYVCRIKEMGRTRRRHSNFGISLYGSNWLIAVDSCQEWVDSMLSLVRNKKSFYQKGLRAIKLIEPI